MEQHNGKWLKEMGDGAMAQFSTALDAVNCAVAIRESARAKFDGKLRIGIHSGDITIENDDVYGDGVNVASRLESIADPGGIYISDSIEKAIQGQTNIQAKYLGEVKLKNVAYGVAVSQKYTILNREIWEGIKAFLNNLFVFPTNPHSVSSSTQLVNHEIKTSFSRKGYCT